MVKRNPYKRCLVILFWLTVWHCTAVIVDNSILLVTPVEAFKAFLGLLEKGEFYFTVGKSLLRIGVGFCTGASAAVILAAGSRRFPLLEEMLSPVFNLIKAVPVASFVVLLLIWWGASFLAVAVSFLVVVPNVYISTLEGLKNTDVRLLEMAKVFRFSFRNRFFYIYRPALKPFLYGSLKVSLGMCWKSGVAAEVIGTPDFSIGERLYLSKIYLDTGGVFAWTAVVVILSVLFEKLVLRLIDCFFSREVSCGQRQVSGVFFGGRRQDFGRGGGNQEKNVEAVRKGLKLKEIVKSYHGKAVVDGISAVYEPGQVYYLTSPSGSGKTTLLRILAKLTKPDEGILEVPETCSMVFQEDRLCEDYNAIKNVELVTKDWGLARKALLNLLEEEVLYRPCSELSGGMKRRVAIVRAMESESEYVLLDEPYTGMDDETRRRTKEYICSRQQGRTLIIATHI